jgi:hypothetical protein
VPPVIKIDFSLSIFISILILLKFPDWKYTGYKLPAADFCPLAQICPPVGGCLVLQKQPNFIVSFCRGLLLFLFTAFFPVE